MRVPGDHGIIGHAEIVFNLVEIRVADSTVVNFDVNIIRASVSANLFYTYEILHRLQTLMKSKKKKKKEEDGT